MEAILKRVEEFNSSSDSRSKLFLFGVLLPGYLLSGEIISWYAALHYSDIASIKGFSNLLEPTSSVLMVSLALLLVVSVSCVIGYINRETIFWLSNRLMVRNPGTSVHLIIRDLGKKHGSTRVDAVISQHNIFSYLTDAANFKTDRRRPHFYDLPEFMSLKFCKLWLSLNNPPLNTGGIETEINLMAGLILPTLISVFPVYFIVGKLAYVLFVAAATGSSYFMLNRVNRLRRVEIEESLLNFVFAHWLADAATKVASETAHDVTPAASLSTKV